jgi:DNA helicase-2/ATP-dependent DNA helicase PcrA
MRQIFGSTRYNRPSRFLSELPSSAAEHRATAAMSGEMRFERYVDRGAERKIGGAGPWRHPQARRASAPDSGERYVDHDFFDDRADEVTDMPVRRGGRVRHDRFGEGEVLRIVSVGEPAVVAFFPGWGEKKILARFLKPAG